MQYNKLAISFLLFFLLSTPLTAQYRGYSSYAALNPRFPCDSFLRISEGAKKPAMVVLYGTFGTDWSCVKRFAKKFRNRDYLIEVHFSNEGCRDRQICYRGEMARLLKSHQYNRKIEQRDQRTLREISTRIFLIKWAFEKLTPPNRGRLAIYALSTGLEDRYTKRAFEVLEPIFKELWPYLLIRSRMGNRSVSADLVGEYHTSQALPLSLSDNILNADGETLTIKASRDYFRIPTLATFLWTKEAQGVGTTFKPPLARTFRIDNIEEYRKLLEHH